MRHTRREHDDHINTERWLISYADFITLMFAFFVVLFASSHGDLTKAKQLSMVFDNALTLDSLSGRLRTVLHKQEKTTVPTPVIEPPQSKMAELKSPLEELTRVLREEITKGSLQVNMTPRGLVISLKQGAFFPAGDATISTDRYPVLERVCQTLSKVQNPIRLEGHTDAMPIRNGKYRSNWELSAARSIAMLELMTSRFGIAPQRLAVVGYADTAPVESNDTEAGRAKNRRVDITLLNERSFGSEPQAH